MTLSLRPNNSIEYLLENERASNPYYVDEHWEISPDDDPSWRRFLVLLLVAGLLIVAAFFVFGRASEKSTGALHYYEIRVVTDQGVLTIPRVPALDQEVLVNVQPGGSIPVWKKYTLVTIANGVNGCANANGCWQINGNYIHESFGW